MVEDNPSRQVVLQRVRNRVIENLELAASYEAQRRFQDDVPYINVPTGVICQWGDQVPTDWQAWLITPVFTPDEIEAVARYDKVLTAVVAGFPSHIPQLPELVGSEAWDRLRPAAIESLAVFLRRGRLSEDIEISRSDDSSE